MQLHGEVRGPVTMQNLLLSHQTYNNFHTMPFFKKTQDQSVCMSENNDDSKAELIHWQCFCVYRRAQEVLTLICGSTGCHHGGPLAGPGGRRKGGEDRRRGEERGEEGRWGVGGGGCKRKEKQRNSGNDLRHEGEEP